MSAEAERAVRSLHRLADKLPAAQARAVAHAVHVIEQQQREITRHFDIYRDQSGRLVDAEIRREHAANMFSEILALMEGKT